MFTVKKCPYIHRYFVASFPYFNGTSSVYVCIHKSMGLWSPVGHCGAGLHYSIDLWIQMYTESVSLKYGKLATKYLWIYRYFLQCGGWRQVERPGHCLFLVLCCVLLNIYLHLLAHAQKTASFLWNFYAYFPKSLKKLAIGSTVLHWSLRYCVCRLIKTAADINDQLDELRYEAEDVLSSAAS